MYSGALGICKKLEKYQSHCQNICENLSLSAVFNSGQLCSRKMKRNNEEMDY